MATVAEELLLDFGSDGEDSQSPENNDADISEAKEEGLEMDVYAQDQDKSEPSKVTDGSKGRVDDFEARLSEVLRRIAQSEPATLQNHSTDARSITENPSYKLMVEANSLYVEMDSRMSVIHKTVQDIYSAKFFELSQLVTGIVPYAQCAIILGNTSFDDVKEVAERTNALGMGLKDVVDKQTLFILTAEATRTRGRDLSQEEDKAVIDGCQKILFLDNSKKILLEFVTQMMTIFAPNVSNLVGSLTAAQLCSVSGGILSLASTPNRNLPSLGSNKQFQAGLARSTQERQRGFLFHSEIFRSIRVGDDFITQSLRVLSAKVILAARMDASHTFSNGSEGLRLREEFIEHMEKIMSAAPNRGPKALPAPDDKPAKKRGGRKVRKMKEATAMTDMAKARNRMAFGQEEQEVGYGTGEGTSGMGMIGQDNDGRIRALKVDQRTAAKLSKKNKGWGAGTPIGGTASSLRGFGSGAGNASVLRAHGLRSGGLGGQTAGTASSIAFTPIQGLELINPEAQKELKRKRDAEDDRWFKGGTFTQVGGKSVLPSSTTNGGFKVPQLPAKAKTTSAGDMGPPPPKKPA